MVKTYIISDIHLGAENCQAAHLLDFLETNIVPDKCNLLIINGDFFDNMECRLRKKHWKILSYIRKIADDIKVVWVRGNHDGVDADNVAHILGIDIVDEYRFEISNKKFVCIHGDIFDDFLSSHYYLTLIADWFYNLLQKMDKKHNWARWAKRSSKTFLRCSDKIRTSAVDYCEKIGYDYVCCGHTHHQVEESPYFNNGCWTELPCGYIEINQEGVINVKMVYN